MLETSKLLSKAFEKQTVKDKQDEFLRNCQQNQQPEAKSRISLHDAIFGDFMDVENVILDHENSSPPIRISMVNIARQDASFAEKNLHPNLL